MSEQPWTQELYEELTEDLPERWIMVSGQGDTATVAVAPSTAFPVQEKLEEGERKFTTLETDFVISFLVQALPDDNLKGEPEE